MSAPVFSCRNVSVRYGEFAALDDVSLDFARNHTYAVIGPNGAGKTTLINVLCGLIKPTEGQVILEGSDVTHYSVERRARLGLGRSFQIVKTFAEMSVRQNLRIGAQRIRYGIMPFWFRSGHDTLIEERVEATLQRIKLSHFADIESGRLSHGSQRALEIGLALITDPSILVLDEPLAGVGHDEIAPMLDLLETTMKDRTVVLIEHNMDAVKRISHEIVVLVAGKVLSKGTSDTIFNDPRVRSAYLGS